MQFTFIVRPSRGLSKYIKTKYINPKTKDVKSAKK